MNNYKGCIGIVQITRFGDLLQTARACEQFKRQNPNYKLVLICRSKFGRPLEFLLNNFFDEIIYIDLKEIITSLESLSPNLDNLASKIESINKQNFDILINFSWSLSSQHLCKSIVAKNYLGLRSNQNLSPIIADMWSTLVYSSVMRGKLNPFNLVDIYMGMMGVKRTQLTHPKPIEGQDLKLVIHPFASQTEKTWKIQKWAEVILQLLKNKENLKIHIVGSANDVESCHKLETMKILQPYLGRLKFDVGNNNMEELSALLQDATLFVGSDSMVGHLAAFHGVRCLTLSKGNVRPHETTPYGLENFNIELINKTNDFSYQLVYSCIRQLLETGNIEPQVIKREASPLSLNNTNIYKTSFSKEGYLDLNDITNKANLHNTFRTIYKILWSFYIENIEDNYPPPNLLSKHINNLKNYIPAMEQLFELVEFGKKYSLFIYEELHKDSPNMNEIKAYSEKLSEIDNLQIFIRNNYPLLGPIIDFFTVKKANLPGASIDEIAGHSVLTYEDYSNLVSALYEIVEHIIEHNQPGFKELKSSQERSG